MYFETKHERAFGTYPLKGDELATALNTALDVGYRAIDTAQMYANEADIGATLHQYGLPRNEIVITSKVPTSEYSPDKFLPSVQQSLTDLRIDKLDVLLLHWPQGDDDVKPHLDMLQEAQQAGLTEHIGVSNYTASQMRTAADFCQSTLVTNQVEFHPLLDQSILLAAANDTGIPLASYCSVARGKVFEYPLFANIAKKYNVTAGQIVLRWILQQGVSINTMSTNRNNIEANFDVLSFTLSSIDMAQINQLTNTNQRLVDRSLVPWAPSWDTV